MSTDGGLVIILNGVSRKKNLFYKKVLPGIEQRYQVEVIETKYRDHAIELGRHAALRKPFAILAAGGDGTLNQVVNGVIRSGTSTLPPVGIIPLGTGNDFAGMAGVEPNTKSILEKLESGGVPTDVGKLTCLDIRGNPLIRYFINVASLGMGPAVVQRLYKSDRSLGPSLTYFKAIVQTFFSHKPEPIEIQSEYWSWKGQMRVFAIANGKSFGSSIFIAPDAEPDDGVFSTFLLGNVPLLKFLIMLQHVKNGNVVHDPRVEYKSCKRISITSPNTCWIETEGELAGILPAEIQILNEAIRIFR